MNSVRNFVSHLGSGLESLGIEYQLWASSLDVALLETGAVWHNTFTPFPFGKREGEFAWVVVYCDKPYMISGFSLEKDGENNGLVFVKLRQIKEGKLIPHTLASSDTEMLSPLRHYGNLMQLANCRAKTLAYFKNRPVTAKVLAQISKPAEGTRV